ncbi:unnamed protein product [Heterobilharzia americana]|nr:unnamed protein product [Heterobilharzia americana]
MEKGVNFLFGKKDQSSTEINVMNESACQKVTECTSDMLVSLANQPSLAYFHIQEHIRKSTPEILRCQSKVEQLNTQIRGCCYDLDCGLDAIQGMTKATTHFSRINELLKSSLFTKLQLDYARMNTLGHKDPQNRKMILVNQGGGDEYRFMSLESTGSSDNQRTLSHLSNTVSTAAVQVREQAVNLTKRALCTRSADVSYTNVLSNPTEMVAPKSASTFEDKRKY